MVGSEVSPDRRPDDRGCRPDGFRSAYPYHRDGPCPRNGRRGEDGIIVKIVFHIFMLLQLRCPFYSTSCHTIIRNCPEIFPEIPSNSAGLPENAQGEWPVTYFRGQIYDFLQPFPEFGRQGTGILSFPVIQKGRIPVRMASGQFLILINRLTEHSDAEFLEILQVRLIYFRKSIRIRKIFCTFAPYSCPDKKEVESRKPED